MRRKLMRTGDPETKGGEKGRTATTTEGGRAGARPGPAHARLGARLQPAGAAARRHLPAVGGTASSAGLAPAPPLWLQPASAAR